eukprot:Rmarinus@m.22477
MASSPQKEASSSTQEADLIKQAINRNKVISYILDHLRRLNCPVQRDSTYVVEDCPDGTAGFYRPETKEVVLCKGAIKSQQMMDTVLSRELLHAYDDCRAYINYDDPVHLACMEIRAAMLTRDCSFMTEIRRGRITGYKQFEKCVKRRAVQSLSLNPRFRGDPEDAVADAFPVCSADTAPFPAPP